MAARLVRRSARWVLKIFSKCSTTPKKTVKVSFRVEESPVFRRDGYDVHSEVVISVADALLGGTAQAQGLYGTIDIPIPPGTQADQQIRLAGKGFAHKRSSSFGDHYVHIKIRVPKED